MFQVQFIQQSCKIDSKLNWVICEIATPSKNPIGLFAKLRKLRIFIFEFLFEQISWNSDKMTIGKTRLTLVSGSKRFLFCLFSPNYEL